MVNAQEWINKEFFTKDVKEKVKKLYIKNDQGVDNNNGRDYYFYKTQLEGEWDLNEFANLEYLEVKGSDFSINTYQKLTKIDLTSCERIKEFRLCLNDGNLVVGGNNALNTLYLEKCENLVEFPVSELLSKLDTLDIKHCPQLKTISNLKELSNLKTLYFYDCPNLTELEGLNKLSELVKLTINNSYWRSACNSKLTSLDLSKMDKLNKLFVGHCSQLESLILVDCPQLSDVSLFNCSKLSKMEGLEELKSLKTLAFGNCSQLSQPNFELMITLQSLSINNCEKFICQPENLPPKVAKLSFAYQKLSDYNFEKLVAEESLTDLTFSSCSNLKELNNLDKLSKLKSLSLYRLNNLINLQDVGELNNLTTLSIKECYNLEKVEGLEKLVKLGQFEFKDCPKLQIFTLFEKWKQGLTQAVQKIQELETQTKTKEKEKQEMEQKLTESKNQVIELEKAKEKAEDDAQQELAEKIKEIEELIKKQLTENEKKILEKLEELFSIFNNREEIKNIENLEKVLKEYRQLDFANTPNLPENFKLENEGIVSHIENFVKCYQNWQGAEKAKDELKANIQQREKEINERTKEIDALKHKVESLNSNFAQEQQFAEQQIKQITGLQNEIDVLKSEDNQQKALLQKQLDEVQKEANQSQEKLTTEQSKAEFLQNKLTKLNQEKSVLQDDLINRDKEITELKKKIETLDFLTEGIDESDDKLKILKNLYNNKIISNNMVKTNNNEQKVYILEWKGADLKDGRMKYDKFAVIAGSEKEELNFYSTFFMDMDNHKFKKGDVYELSTPGSFIQDSSEIIQGTDQGGHELERVFPSLMIKELWEEKESNLEKLNALEEDLEKRKEEINRINEELANKKREFTNLQSRFNNLQTEKTRGDEEIVSLKGDIRIKEEVIQQRSQELDEFKTKTVELKNQVGNLQTEKSKMEDEWLPPEEKAKLIQEKENLKSQREKETTDLDNKLKKERREKQKLIESLDNLRDQRLGETIEKKLADKKKELEKLKVDIAGLGSEQKFLLENFLEKQEDFDIALFDDVSQTGRTFQRAKERLQDAKDKLIAKIGYEEVEELCRMQNDIGKLETSQKQWEKMEDQQRKEEQEQYETHIETPPMTPRNN